MRRILVMNERDLRHPQAGGAEVHCFEVFRRLVAGGDEVTLLSVSFPGAAAEEWVAGIRVRRLGPRPIYYLRVPAAYRRVRREAPLDVVVEDLNKFPFFARLWVREPVVVLAHHLFGRTAFRQVAFPIAAATVAAEWLVPRLYRGLPVVAVSASTRDELTRGGLRPTDVRVIPNGLDHAHYRPGPGPRAASPTVLVLGRVEPYKRVDLLVDAVAALPGVRLVVAGTGTGLDAVRDGETGLLVRPGDVPALAAALRRVLEDDGLRERLGAAALRWAARFTWDGVAVAVSAVLDEARGAVSDRAAVAGRA